MATSSEVTSALADITLTRPETRMSRARGQVNLMLESRNARKRAEADVQLLANRLQHLKFEEQRANAKIDETRKRTQQVLNSLLCHFKRASVLPMKRSPEHPRFAILPLIK